MKHKYEDILNMPFNFAKDQIEQYMDYKKQEAKEYEKMKSKHK